MRSIVFLAAFVLIVRASGFAQETDPRSVNVESILAAARQVRVPHARTISSLPAEGEKCGLWISLAILRNWDKFSQADRAELTSFLAAPQTQTQRVIGHFLVHYDTTGPDAAAMLDVNNLPIPNSSEQYVDSVGKFFNDVFTREIDSLGYDSPLQAGQTTYDIYVADITYYGLTRSESAIAGFVPPRYVTSIQIDNDYREFYSRGMAGLKVTAAHEFHHAIQLGSYGLWASDAYFLEITSTWMEDVMYTDVNDYYQYVKDPLSFPVTPRGQFATPEVTFTQSNGLIEYSRSVWGKFLEQRYSADVMRRTWEEIRQVPALTALDRALGERQSSLRQAFFEWTVWNSRTGPLADTVTGYHEANNYPLMRTRPVAGYVSPGRTLSDSIQSFSSVYRPVVVGGNQMLAMISNVNASLPAGWLRFSYVMQDGENATFKHLANGISVKVEVQDPENWTSQENVPSLVSDALVYPNPFVRGKSPMLVVRLPYVTDKTATFFVMSAGMERIFSGELPVVERRPLEQSIEWNVRTNAGENVPSGIYIFIATIDGREYKGKFTVIGG